MSSSPAAAARFEQLACAVVEAACVASDEPQLLLSVGRLELLAKPGLPRHLAVRPDGHRAVHGGLQQLALVREDLVDGRIGEARFEGDVLNPRSLVALPREDGRRGLPDPCPGRRRLRAAHDQRRNRWN